jgi:hypothetical protein
VLRDLDSSLLPKSELNCFTFELLLLFTNFYNDDVSILFIYFSSEDDYSPDLPSMFYRLRNIVVGCPTEEL